MHELSGGQLRRVALARILLLEPRIVILDEPTSGLDLSVQATVLSLIADLKARLGLTYLLISHDLSVVERMCDRVAIMYLGRIVEAGPARAIFEAPRHPYTRALLAAAPRLEPGRQLGGGILEGEPPSPRKLPSGCAFRTRCPHAARTMRRCRAGAGAGGQRPRRRLPALARDAARAAAPKPGSESAMKAAYYTEATAPPARCFEVGELPDPRTGSRRGARARSVTPASTHRTAIAAAARRDRPGYPLIIPHSDGAGEIDKVGAGVEAERASASACGPGTRSAAVPSAPPRSTSACPRRKPCRCRPAWRSSSARASACRP